MQGYYGALQHYMRWVLTARLSQIPLAIFAKVSAEHGAISTMSAHRRSSMWRIGSPIVYSPYHEVKSNVIVVGLCQGIGSHIGSPLVRVPPDSDPRLGYLLGVIERE